MPFALQHVDGPRGGEILPLISQTLTIGRSVGELLLEDTEVSSKHCTVQMNAGELIIVDHASRNGTLLNGQRVDRSRLRAGDQLRIGSVVFRVIEWPEAPEFLDPLLMTKNWCQRISEEGNSQFSPQIAQLVEKEISLCLNDIQLKLTIESKDGRVLNHLIPVSEAVLGRAGPIPLLAEDEEASRKHARVSVTPDGYLQVEDMGSANGTFVNEERLAGRRKLQSCDVVRLGKTNIQFSFVIEEFNLPVRL